MNNKNENISKDEMALEAFLAAAFKLALTDKISDDHAIKIFQQSPNLSQEDKDAIASWGVDFIEKIIKGEKNEPSKVNQDIDTNKESELEIYAMNRDENGNDIDEKARRKIDEERQKALEEENEGDKQNES